MPIQACSRYAAPDGNDANPGTAASPVATLHRLTSVLQPGQTGCLKDDSEIVLPATGGLGVMLGGTAGQPKIIRPETPGQRATVIGPQGFLVAANQSDLIIKDIDIRGAADVGGGNLFHINGDRVMLDGVDISWPRNICLGVGAADGQFAEDFVLIDSRIHDCGATHINNPDDTGGAHGAYLQYVRDGAADDDGWGAIIYNTLFDHNQGRGLQLYPDADHVLVDHAVMYGNGANLNLGAVSTTVRPEGNRVRNTILADSRLDFDAPTNPNPTSTEDVVGYFPNDSHNGADNKIIDSCLSNTVRPGRLFSVIGNGNSLVLDNVTQDQPPTFVNVGARDFRLVAGSTCLGMGLSDASRLPYGPGTLPATVPGQPQNVTAVATSNTSARVSFSAPASNGGSAITKYQAYCSSTNGGTIGTGLGTGSPIYVGNLTTGKTYRCRVRAENAAGWGTYSPYSATFIAQVTPPGQPQNVSAVATSNTSARVSFSAPASNGGSAITKYQAYCSSTNGGTIRTGLGTGSPIYVGNLTTGKTYRCRVRAENAAGWGTYSPYSTSFIAQAPPGLASPWGHSSV